MRPKASALRAVSERVKSAAFCEQAATNASLKEAAGSFIIADCAHAVLAAKVEHTNSSAQIQESCDTNFADKAANPLRLRGWPPDFA